MPPLDPSTLVAELLGRPPVAATRLGGGDIADAWLLTLEGGERAVLKTMSGADADFFAAEARGLEWLHTPQGPPVPRVLAAGPAGIVMEYAAPGAPTPDAAADFGRRLARMHAASPGGFGAPWPGFIGSIPMDNASPDGESWADFFARCRVAPYVRAARDRGSLSATDAHVIESLLPRLADLVPAEPPARLHGDLWSGNVHWGKGSRVWLIDPAAHGGHRESDLAMLALFGAPHLDAIVTAYQEEAPLATGWRDRIPIHQLFPLLVHAELFGGGYGPRAAAGVAPFAAR